MLVFDVERHDGLTTEFGDRFDVISDRVMGGVSSGSTAVETVAGRTALRLRGEVRLENNGGFVQLATDLAIDVSRFSAFRLEVCGNDETYGCHLRTTKLWRIGLIGIGRAFAADLAVARIALV